MLLNIASDNEMVEKNQLILFKLSPTEMKTWMILYATWIELNLEYRFYSIQILKCGLKSIKFSNKLNGIQINMIFLILYVCLFVAFILHILSLTN
jgi:hypothetical protein